MIHILLVAAAALVQPIQPQYAYVRTINRTDGIDISQTEIRQMTAPGKPDVWLVGASHIGSKPYYAQIQSVLDAQQVVLYEAVRSKERPSAIPKPNPKAPKPLYQILSDALGLDFQLVDIQYDRPNWVNSDMTMEELDKLNTQGGKGAPTQFSMIEQMLKPDSPQAKMIASFFETATPSTKLAFKIFLIEKLAEADAMFSQEMDATTRNVILTVRNESVERAFDKVISAPKPPTSVAIFYGALHQPSIQNELTRKYGYKAGEQRWLTFATADKSKLDEAGRQVLDMLEKSVGR